MAALYVIGFVLAFLLILASGLPVGFGLGFLALGLMMLFVDSGTALTMGVDKAYHALDSNILVAVPLFILAAQLISATGMGKRLFDAAKAFLWRLRGGLGVATIASSGVFSAMTGSSFVSASTMGLIAIPELRKAGYSDRLIAGAISAGGSLGSVIPPSLVLIIYGYLTDESIGALFMAGMVPGILLMLMYSVALAWLSPKNALTGTSGSSTTATTLKPPKGAKRRAVRDAFWGLLAPVIILGGIYLGIFTASEAAAVAVLYCLFIGFVVYRSLTVKKVWQLLLEAMSTSAMVAIIIIGGAMLGQAVILGRIPQDILAGIIAADLSEMTLLIVINLILFVLGMFLEVLALIYLVIPLLIPVILHMGWDNIWFAVILLLNVNLALITPPMGGVLYVVSHIGNIPLGTVIRGTVMPISILVLLLILIIAFPQIATWLPQLLGS